MDRKLVQMQDPQRRPARTSVAPAWPGALMTLRDQYQRSLPPRYDKINYMYIVIWYLVGAQQIKALPSWRHNLRDL